MRTERILNQGANGVSDRGSNPVPPTQTLPLSCGFACATKHDSQAERTLCHSGRPLAQRQSRTRTERRTHERTATRRLPRVSMEVHPVDEKTRTILRREKATPTSPLTKPLIELPDSTGGRGNRRGDTRPHPSDRARRERSHLPRRKRLTEGQNRRSPQPRSSFYASFAPLTRRKSFGGQILQCP